MYLAMLLPIAAVLVYGIWRLLGRTRLGRGGRLVLSLLLGAAVSALLLWCVLAVTILLWQWNDPVHM